MRWLPEQLQNLCRQAPIYQHHFQDLVCSLQSKGNEGQLPSLRDPDRGTINAPVGDLLVEEQGSTWKLVLANRRYACVHHDSWLANQTRIYAFGSKAANQATSTWMHAGEHDGRSQASGHLYKVTEGMSDTRLAMRRGTPHLDGPQ